ncbi:S41 family peptidase [Chitinophaga caseinilytica]|uniref:S41 family peptidase n=1 Tax=Chitinophaga caseinilytica TaxID=2267521 RepID=A0ABZ2ZCA2_9BACT
MNHRSRPFIVAALAVSCSFSAHAQEQKAPGPENSFRSAVIKNVLEKIKTRHFSPRPFDDAWSAAVYDKYLQLLDAGKQAFLTTDIRRLQAQRLQVDDQLLAGQTAFFDSVYAIYRLRLNENQRIIMQALDGKFDFDRKESVQLTGAARDYAAGGKEKEEMLRKLVKYQVLRNYMDLKAAEGDTLATAGVPDPATEAKARERVRKWYADFFRVNGGANDEDEKFNLYMAAAVSEIDPHTVYSGPKDKSLQQNITKRYFGIGMELGERDGDFYIKRLLPGGAAFKSGRVRENDNILSISGENGKMVPVRGLTAGEVSAMIRGDKDTELQLKLQQPGDSIRTVMLKRGEVVDMENRAKSAVLERNGKKFGYISLPLFYMDPSGYGITGASADVAREVEKLKEQEVEGIIMDLRGNGGGSLDEVVRMSSLFLPAGPVSWLRSQQEFKPYNSPMAQPAYEGPLVVMVDEKSASASEILAAVIQDKRRGLIVGPSSTYGKGTAQIPVNMGKMGDPARNIPSVSYGTLQMTVQKFYRVTGESTQLKGVIPDVVLQESMSPHDQRERDFPSSMACDTVRFPAFEPAGPGFRYGAVVDSARSRIARNPAFAEVAVNMERQKEHASLPVPLDMRSFRQHYNTLSRIETGIRNARTLPPAQALGASLPMNRSLRPDLRKDESSLPANQDWLKGIAQDIYIGQSVAILEDMAANPEKPGKK